MSQAIDKNTDEHTGKDMRKRDGETNMAVGLFLFALGIPVFLGTFWALDRPHAALVNAICGATLLLIGGVVVVYGWLGFRRATKKN
ncbi:MAG TPA: hypothetical protein PLL36_13480 [Candidatus Hydrogenedentes bacterium]|jgi:uncharacterized membrane protein YgdD (TMEM256/DUF423 family)|nr:MAG: hypothetical protein BWX80_01251 [Candidatus Hydrogenedentes bacterium ADurb.Bin101]HOC67663.1 hypothetical protein [Candidatus Hydrogenedentota bacterium]HQN02085.1 hypothetical protein [Candidatus Hydrogenedentota bacterium]